MFQPFITGIFRYQYLLLTFRLPQSGYGLRGFKIASVQGQGVMYTCLAEPVAQFHHFGTSGIDVCTGIGKQIPAVEPEFESTVIRLTMPLSFRSGFNYHDRCILLPTVSESKETGCQCPVGKIRERSAFTPFCRIITYPIAVGEQCKPIAVVGKFCLIIAQLGITETRVGVVGKTNVGIESNHILDRIQVF